MEIKHLKNLLKISLLILSATQLISCANNYNSPQDPYENYNRAVFKFNTKVDKTMFRPVARTYNKAVPGVVQARVSSFFVNISEVPTVMNDILQLEPVNALKDSGRFVINSTVGLAGLFDVAAKMNLPRHQNDFGLTLAYWGMQRSPYYVLPFFGPSTIRDSLAEPVAVYSSPLTYVPSEAAIYSLFVVNKVNQRAALLPADALVDDAFDPYVFVRDAYLQNRQNKMSEMKIITTTNENTGAASNNGDDTYVASNDNNAATNNKGKDTYVAGNENKTTTTKTDKDTYVANSKNVQIDNNKVDLEDEADLPTPMELTAN
jgi:phospholipid-binding lipoprotein MlaA